MFCVILMVMQQILRMEPVIWDDKSTVLYHVQYLVQVRPITEAWIWLYEGTWKVIRKIGGILGKWEGEYESAQEVLALLQKEYEAAA